jgi:hypothetical protein
MTSVVQDPLPVLKEQLATLLTNHRFTFKDVSKQVLASVTPADVSECVSSWANNAQSVLSAYADSIVRAHEKDTKDTANMSTHDWRMKLKAEQDSAREKRAYLEENFKKQMEEARTAWKLMMEDELRKQRDCLVTEITRQMNEEFHSKLSPLLAEVRTFRSEYQSLRGDVTVLKEEFNSEAMKKKLLDEVVKSIPFTPEDAKRMGTEITDLRSSTAELKRQLELANAALQRAEDHNEELRRMFREAQERMFAMEEELLMSKQLSADLQAERERLEQELAEQRERSERLSHHVRILQTAREEAEQALQKTQTQLKQAEQQNRALDDKQNSADAEMAAAQEWFDSVLTLKQHEIDHMQGVVRDLQLHIQNCEEMYNDRFADKRQAGQTPRSCSAGGLGVGTLPFASDPQMYSTIPQPPPRPPSTSSRPLSSQHQHHFVSSSAAPSQQPQLQRSRSLSTTSIHAPVSARDSLRDSTSSRPGTSGSCMSASGAHSVTHTIRMPSLPLHKLQDSHDLTASQGAKSMNMNASNTERTALKSGRSTSRQATLVATSARGESLAEMDPQFVAFLKSRIKRSVASR